jgi:hypothetical protein
MVRGVIKEDAYLSGRKTDRLAESIPARVFGRPLDAVTQAVSFWKVPNELAPAVLFSTHTRLQLHWCALFRLSNRQHSQRGWLQSLAATQQLALLRFHQVPSYPTSSG